MGKINKAYLKSYKWADVEVKQLKEQIDAINTLLYSVKGSNFDARISGGGIDDRNTALISQKMDLEELYNAKIQELFYRKREIENAISKLEPVERIAMRARFIECRTLEDICANVLHYEWSWTNTIIARAIKKLESED